MDGIWGFSLSEWTVFLIGTFLLLVVILGLSILAGLSRDQ